jgi:alpha-tubulin suppressor-like RCC1 family protein
VAVLLADATVRLWGFDGYGQTGVGTSGTSSETDGAYKRTPAKPAITNVASIYLGGYRSIAVRTDGTLWIWGGTSSTGSGILGRNLKVSTVHIQTRASAFALMHSWALRRTASARNESGGW